MCVLETGSSGRTSGETHTLLWRLLTLVLVLRIARPEPVKEGDGVGGRNSQEPHPHTLWPSSPLCLCGQRKKTKPRAQKRKRWQTLTEKQVTSPQVFYCWNLNTQRSWITLNTTSHHLDAMVSISLRLLYRTSWWLGGKESICQCRRWGSTPGSGRSPGGGNGNPLQHSCLGNHMDRGSWWATVHGVTKSQTWLRTHTLPTTAL